MLNQAAGGGSGTALQEATLTGEASSNWCVDKGDGSCIDWKTRLKQGAPPTEAEVDNFTAWSERYKKLLARWRSRVDGNPLPP